MMSAQMKIFQRCLRPGTHVYRRRFDLMCWICKCTLLPIFRTHRCASADLYH